MTALSGIARMGGAFLFTDGATLDRHHRLATIGSKVFDLAPQRMAIGWSGYIDDVAEVERAIADAGPSQDQIFAALPAISRRFASANVAIGKRDGVETPPLYLLVALWSVKNSEGQLWAIHSGNELFGPSYTPFTPVRLSFYTALPPTDWDAAFGRSIDFVNRPIFDVRDDGLRLLEAERALPYADGHFAVGGFAELTSVTAGGVECETLRVWPDKIGEHIDPGAV